MASIAWAHAGEHVAHLEADGSVRVSVTNGYLRVADGCLVDGRLVLDHDIDPELAKGLADGLDAHLAMRESVRAAVGEASDDVVVNTVINAIDIARARNSDRCHGLSPRVLADEISRSIGRSRCGWKAYTYRRAMPALSAEAVNEARLWGAVPAATARPVEAAWAEIEREIRAAWDRVLAIPGLVAPSSADTETAHLRAAVA